MIKRWGGEGGGHESYIGDGIMVPPSDVVDDAVVLVLGRDLSRRLTVDVHVL